MLSQLMLTLKKSKKEYSQEFQEVLQKISKKDILIQMGDWNAKIGKEAEQGITGKHGLGNRNKAGKKTLSSAMKTTYLLQILTSNYHIGDYIPRHL